MAGRVRTFPATIPAILDLRKWEIYEHCRAHGGEHWQEVYAKKLGLGNAALCGLQWTKRFNLGSQLLARLERFIRRKESFRSDLDRTVRKILRRRAQANPEWQPDAFCQEWINEYYLNDWALAAVQASAAQERAKQVLSGRSHTSQHGFGCSMPSRRPTHVIRV